MMTTEKLSPGHEGGPAWPAGSEDFLQRPDGVRLFTRSATPPKPPRATVVLTHGLGEHSNRYGHVAAALVARGCQVVGWDLRGHGRSSGVRGDVAEYRCLTEDLAAVCARYHESDRPLFLFAHSLGGQIALRFLQEKSA